MAGPDVRSYRSPHVSEVVGPPPYDDCLPSAGLECVADWTAGDVLLDDDWTILRPAERTTLREELRDILPQRQQVGGLAVRDLETMVQAKWPYLPHLPYFDAADQLRTFDDVLADLRTGEYVGLALGNPSRAPSGSKLRRWTRGDDYKHFLRLVRANQDAVRVSNPLAPYQLDNGEPYVGEWIPIREVRAFCDTFDAKTHVKVSMFRVGEQSTLAIAKRAAADAQAELEGQVSRLTDQLADAKSNVAELRKVRDQLKARIAELESAPKDCSAEVQAAVSAATAPLTDRIARIAAITQEV